MHRREARAAAMHWSMQSVIFEGFGPKQWKCKFSSMKLTGWKAEGDFSSSEARTFFGKAEIHSWVARAAVLVLRYCNALKHAECNIWRVLAQSNGYACFVVLSLQETKGVRQHIATPLAPLLRSKPCQCLPSFFGQHNKPAIHFFCHLRLAKGANRIGIMQRS